MTQDEKDILLKDLCARLPYGVMLKHISTEKPFKLFSIKRDEYASYKKDGVELAVNGIYYDWYVNDTYHDIELYIKPYLFPLSSMTEEQRKEYNSLRSIGVDECGDITCFDTFESVDWCNKNHFDYRGLIPMGLAEDATGKNIY
jgi:hypothetical protein